jgi:hypothetical protein
MLNALSRAMEHLATHRAPGSPPSRTPDRRVLLALGSALVVLAFFILREHWDHVLGLAPYLLLLACPLMHLFGHHGHGGSEHEHGPKAPAQ